MGCDARGCKRLDTSTQGEYTKPKAAYENFKDFNVSKRQSQILPLRPIFSWISPIIRHRLRHRYVFCFGPLEDLLS